MDGIGPRSGGSPPAQGSIATVEADAGSLSPHAERGMIMLLRTMILFGVLAATFLPANASAERRVALVIGNSAYSSATSLRNPRNDATDIADTLKKVGFEVELGLDLDQRGFAQAIESFARALDGADAGLFFYAGHGVQMNDKNYLVSVNAKLDSEFLLSSETIELDAVVRLMESKTPVNLVFLDACRNNPLIENLRRNLMATKRSASLGRGLARIEPSGRDTLIAFAAAPGQEATDGVERNSPFTASLLQHLPKPGLEVSVMLKEVAADVRRDTRNSQGPQQLSDMARPFYFVKAAAATTAKVEPAVTPELIAKPAPQTATSPQPVDDRALDVAFWNAAQSANDCDAVRAYQQRFPKGVFIELAKLSERRLCVSDRKVVVLDSPSSGSLTAPPSNPPPVLNTGAATPVAPSGFAAAPSTGAPAPASAPPPAAPTIVVSAATDKTAVPPAVRPTGPTTTELTRIIQLELYRLGCGPSDADGRWNMATREGLRKFNKSARAKLGLDEPASATVVTLQSQAGRICPLECGRGLQARGDTCVAIVKEAPKKKAQRAERVRPRRAVATEGSAPPQQQAVQPAPPVTFGGPPMGGMFFFGMGRRGF